MSQTKPANITMTVTPEIASKIVDMLNLSVECLQGTTETLPDGRLLITLTIIDEQKIELCREFALKPISESHLKNLN